MNSHFKLLLPALLVAGFCQAQTKAADSVVIRVGESSKVIFAIHDKADLETLKHYDFQALMSDMLVKLEKKDTTPNQKSSQDYLKDSANLETPTATEKIDNDEDWDNHHGRHYHGNRRTYQSLNIDVGTNNYLEGGKFPDETNQPYSVHPWGSWYIGINSIQRTHVAGKFFLEWGGGVSWYNFKFQDDRIAITKTSDGLLFQQDPRDLNFQKSKLTAAYVNASIVPVIDFGENRRKASFLNDDHSESFRLGVGPYIGYRLDSYTKQMYIQDGNKQKERNHDSYYLNNIRYGLRMQLGFRDVDVFFNYDLNTLYTESVHPRLNAFSFGVTF